MLRVALSTLVALVLVSGLCAKFAFAEQVKCEGTITKVEGEKVTVKDASNHEQHMMVVPATKVMIDGKAAKSTDLKVGQHVSCTCDKKGDTMTCNSLEAKTR